MALVALLSNPRSTGNRAILPRVRSYCAHRPEVFHYEVESVDQIAEALRTIARVRPQVLIVNGGDGTVQAALTELYHGDHFGDDPPPVAVLPNGKTNLIALDLGARGDPLQALDRIIEIARQGVGDHVVRREMILLSDGNGNARPTLGMFLGGAGLADSILFCRNSIYPLGLPNWLSHVLTVFAILGASMTGARMSFLPSRPKPMSVSVMRSGELTGRFTLLMVTTLEKLLINVRTRSDQGGGPLKMMAIEDRGWTLLRAMMMAFAGRLGRHSMAGLHLAQGDEIRIEGERSSVILDGELFESAHGRPIVLRSTAPMPFLRLAA
jgi:hypothetical protein